MQPPKGLEDRLNILAAEALTIVADGYAPVFIFPNPLNPKRYLVVNNGFTFAAAGSGSNAQQTPKLPDYAVLDITLNGAVVLADFFDEQWRLK